MGVRLCVLLGIIITDDTSILEIYSFLQFFIKNFK